MTVTRERISAAAHARLAHANPLSSAQMGELVARAAATDPATALDIGCGPGAFAVGLAARRPVRVRAVEPNGHFVERGRVLAAERELVGSVAFEERALSDADGHERFDVVACIGSSSAIGTPRDALRRCHELVSERGVVVFADLVWAAEPPPEFLDLLGSDADTFWRREDALHEFEACGLESLWSCAASRDSWEAYERAVLAGRLALSDQLRSVEGETLRESATVWYDAYQRHGRVCFGFDAHVARRARRGNRERSGRGPAASQRRDDYAGFTA